jgi:hypothetical protein
VTHTKFTKILEILVTFGLRADDSSATATLANLVAFAFFPFFIFKDPTIDCEHEQDSGKNKMGFGVLRRFDKCTRILKVQKFEN